MDNPSKDPAMGDVLLEAHAIVRLAAEPWEVGDSVKAAINRAARRLGLGYRRVRSLWYLEPCALRADEWVHLRRQHLELMRDAQRQAAARHAYLAAKIAALENSHGDVLARVARARMDRRGEVGAGPGGGLPAQAGGDALPDVEVNRRNP